MFAAVQRVGDVTLVAAMMMSEKRTQTTTAIRISAAVVVAELHESQCDNVGSLTSL